MNNELVNIAKNQLEEARQDNCLEARQEVMEFQNKINRLTKKIDKLKSHIESQQNIVEQTYPSDLSGIIEEYSGFKK